MINEVFEYLNPKKEGVYVDCTLGGGSYTFSLAEKLSEKGKIIAIDLDEDAILNGQKEIKKQNYKNIKLVNDNFRNLSNIIKDSAKFTGTEEIDGIMMDLGVSSHQLQDESRGFSFKHKDSLDMGFGSKFSNRTKEIINYAETKELEEIIKNYGEERFARKISEEIIKRRKIKEIENSAELSDLILSVIPRRFQSKRIHPATKTFQALRVATNEEIENLELVLPQALEKLKIGGRIVAVSFHSLEDRIVKRFFKKESLDCICSKELPICQCRHQPRLRILTKKPVTPTNNEILNNAKARSAKLRASEKIV